MLPVAAKLKAFWDRLVDHTDPEDTFKRTVTASLLHLEERIEQIAHAPAVESDVPAKTPSQATAAATAAPAAAQAAAAGAGEPPATSS